MIVDLNRAGNFHGPLAGSLRMRLMAAINDPGEATWEDAYAIILQMRTGPGEGFGMTLWQAVAALDPGYSNIGPTTRWVEDDTAAGGHCEPCEGWQKIPPRELIISAINYATR